VVSVSFFVSIEYAPVHIPTCSANRGAQFPDYGGSDDKERGSAHEEIEYLPGYRSIEQGRGRGRKREAREGRWEFESGGL
jgi:hypothetical protein